MGLGIRPCGGPGRLIGTSLYRLLRCRGGCWPNVGVSGRSAETPGWEPAGRIVKVVPTRNGVVLMPQGRRPARAVAIAVAAEENRCRLLFLTLNCILAASLLVGLALAVF